MQNNPPGPVLPLPLHSNLAKPGRENPTASNPSDGRGVPAAAQPENALQNRAGLSIPAAVAPAAAGGVVQRSIVDGLQEKASGALGLSSRADQSGSSTPDLGQLAEDVIPYVKRLLEIEAERAGRRR
jgi:hypothetical protein